MKLLISFANVNPRTAASVAKRALALYAVYEHTQKPHSGNSLNWVNENAIYDYLSPTENYFLYKTINPTVWQSSDYAWQLEGTVPLLWALGLIKQSPVIDDIGDFDAMQSIFHSAIKDPADFIKQAKIRPFKEINEVAKRYKKQRSDLISNQILKNHPVKDILLFNADEWLRAFNWLTSPNSEWDRVRIDG